MSCFSAKPLNLLCSACVPYSEVANPPKLNPHPCISPSSSLLCHFKTLDVRALFSELLLYFINRMRGRKLLSQTLKDLHLEHSQLLKRPTRLTALFDGCRLSSLPPYFSRAYQHLQPVGVGPLQGQRGHFGLLVSKHWPEVNHHQLQQVAEAG